MKQEIGVLVLFLVVFIYDIFAPARSSKAIAWISTVGMLLLTVAGFFPCLLGVPSDEAVSVFNGMYVT